MGKTHSKPKRQESTEAKTHALPRWVVILVALVPVAAFLWTVFKDTAV